MKNWKRRYKGKLRKFTRREQGAVSVFLVMILVPCMLVASIFVDAGRVYLSQSQAMPAAELALNSVMTHYDFDLNDWYGMVASCQNVDEFYATSEKWFIDSMKSQGVDIQDYLKVTKTDGDSSGIKAVDNANLSNAVMLKSSIVDFMKYRGPVTVCEDLIDRFKSDDMKGQMSDLEESDKNEELVQAKRDYYEEQGDLQKETYATYKVLMKYYTDAGYSNQTLTDIADRYRSYKDVYSEAHKKMVEDLYNTKNLSSYARPKYNANDYANIKASDYDGTFTKNKDGNYPNASTAVSGALKDLNDARASLKNEEKKLSGTWKDYPVYSESSHHDIQYWQHVWTAGQSGITKVNNAAGKYARAYAVLSAMSSHSNYGDAIDSSTQSSVSKALTQASADINERFYVGDSSKKYNKYRSISESLEGIADNSDKQSRIDSVNAKIYVDGSWITIDAALKDVAAKAAQDTAVLDQMEKILKAVRDGGSVDENYTNLYSLSTIREQVKKTKNELNDWSKTANSVNTNMASDDKKEITTEQENRVTEQDIDNLKSRVNNMLDQISNLKEAIKKVKYNGTEIASIDSYSDMVQAASKSGGIKESKIVYNKSKLNSYVTSSFNDMYKPGEFKFTLNSSDDHNMKIDPITEAVATPQAYILWYNKFKDTEDKSQKEVENVDAGDIKKLKNTADSKGKDDKNKEGNEDPVNVIRAYGPADQVYSLVKQNPVTSIADIVKLITSDNVEALRDNLYLLSYMNHMFSYDTYKNEIRYRNLSSVDGISLEKAQDMYKALDDKLGNSSNQVNVKEAINTSLTNKYICSDYNASYGAELEYILYGKDSSKDNVKAAYTDIFAIREIENLVSGFQHFWKNDLEDATSSSINIIANTVSSATGRVIPAAAVKAVLIAALATLESLQDLERLKAGLPIEIYKASADDWKYAIPSVSSDPKAMDIASLTPSSKVETVTKKNGLFYSDYLNLFLLSCLNEDKGKLGAACTLRMADLIQQNMGKITGDNSFKLSKSITYFEINEKLRIDPLMMTLPIFSNENSGYDRTKTDWCTYDVKVTRGY